MKLSLRKDAPLLVVAVAVAALAVPDPMLRSSAVHLAAGLGSLALSFAFLVRARRHPEERRGSWWCATGTAISAARWLSAAVATAVFHKPTPAWAIALVVPGNLLVVIGLLVMPVAPEGRAARIRTGIDAFAFGLAALCLMWLAGLTELAGFVALPLGSRILAIAPFLMNATIMGTIVYLASPRPGRYLGTLGMALACVIVASTVNLMALMQVLAGPHGANVHVRVIGAAALALLAWVLARGGPMDEERHGERVAPLGGLMPMLPTLGLLVVLFVRHARGNLAEELPLLWLVYPLVAVLLLRQIIALEDLRRLSSALEDKVAERSAALAEVQDQLQRRQRLEGLGRLAGGVAHDFNNLLTGISGYTHLMARRAPAGSEAASHALEIRRAVERGAGLTRQILTFASRQPGEPQHVAPAQVVRELAGLLAHGGQSGSGEVQLDVDPAAVEARVHIDPAQLEQVVMALATNAHEAMPRGGRVRVAVGLRRLGPDDPEAADSPMGDYVTITVADQGVGMPPAVIARLFEPFFTTKPRGAGAGLGLATSFGIVRQAGGFFVVASAEGEGSRFVVHLPLARADATPTKPTSLTPPPVDDVPRLRHCVLLVDDSPALRTTLAAALREAGYAVIVAASGEEAVTLADKHADVVDVLVSDVVMPGIDGLETAKRITARRPGLPVILISGFTDTPRDRLPREYGFLAKPFAPPELVERIRKVGGAGRERDRGHAP